jgi:UDP-N-acetylmuramate--alanine ligase
MTLNRNNIAERYEKNAGFYLIGIGGCGMSSLAHILLDCGYSVAGSDIQESIYTEQLEQRGVTVFKGHSAGALTSFNPDIVIYSSAISKSANPEYQEAERLGKLLYKRGYFLAEFTRSLNSVCVAGMHGKTTTSAMLAYAFEQLKHSLGHSIGWYVPQLGRHGRLNTDLLKSDGVKDKFFTIEVDESDGTFTLFYPAHSIILNIDREHMDYFGDFERLKGDFAKFIGNTIGYVVYCADNEELVSLVGNNSRAVSYGFSESSQYRPVNYKFSPESGWDFEVVKNGNSIGRFKLQLLGLHNVLNAVAVITMLDLLGFKATQIAEAISSFKGAARRQEELYNDGFIRIFDDYGHHPAEIRATINALKPLINNRLLVVFQPHRFTRTRDLLAQFGTCFEGASKVWIMDIYGAGEEPIPGVTGELIVNELRKNGFDVMFEPAEDAVAESVLKELKVGDVALFCGAGANVTRAANKLADKLKSKVYHIDIKEKSGFIQAGKAG